MPEENTTPEGSMIDENGLLVENFTDFLDEEIRGSETLKTMPRDIPGIIKMTVNAQTKMGKNRIALPTEGSATYEQELEDFYNAIGRPSTVDDYGNYERDPEVPEDLYDEERVGRFKALAHKIGLTKKQADALVGFDNDELKTALASTQKAEEQELAGLEERLKAKMGMAYEELIHASNVFINETTEEGEDRDEFIKEFGRNERFIEWSAKVAKKFIEHKALVAELTQKTPMEAQASIRELQATPGYMNGELQRTNPGKHERITKELEELFKQAYPKQRAG